MRIECRVSANEMTSGERKNVVHGVRGWLLSVRGRNHSTKNLTDTKNLSFAKISIIIVARWLSTERKTSQRARNPTKRVFLRRSHRSIENQLRRAPSSLETAVQDAKLLDAYYRICDTEREKLNGLSFEEVSKSRLCQSAKLSQRRQR